MAAETEKDAFTAELFEYWIPRLAADGVDVNDVLTVRNRVAGWADWPATWGEIGDDYRALAATRLADGHGLSAGEALVRASLAYHCGQVVAFHAPVEKADLQARKVAAFREAAPLLTPPAERIEVAFGELKLPGFLRVPAGANGPVACVLLVPGLDSTKEDFTTIADMCARRGLASFAFDGPGQGEVREAAPLAEGYEDCIAAVFEAIAQRPEIDAARIGTLGRSLGGYYVVRAAAADPRIAATVVFGGAYDLSDFPNMPVLIRDGFRHATGGASEDEALALMGAATLDDCIAQVQTPVLVVHGKRDGIFHWSQATRIADALSGHATLMMDEDGVHCCHNHAFQYRTAMADWLAAVL
ncbi:MAG: 2,6-dihydroxypseudooxynicotine hydrolase [Alphaproteobacteria bacterium]|jgi:2,6-dihydroxypseudooxynicotine hydrolase